MPFSPLAIKGETLPLFWHSWGDPHNPPIMLFHGFLGSGKVWEPVASHFSDAFYVIAPDLPFHGQSPVSDTLWEKSLTFEDIAQVIAQWLTETIPTPLPAVGYSMGGRLLLFMAVHHPEIFTHLVLESTTAGLASARERQKRRQFDTEMAEELRNSDLEAFLRAWYSQPMWGYLNAHPRFEALIQMRLHNDREQLARSLSVLGTGVQPSVWDKLEDVHQPVLLLAGEYDARYINIMDAIRRQLPHSEFHVIANSGHNIHFEQPEIFVKLVRKFLTA